LNSIHSALGSLSKVFGLCVTLSAIEQEWESMVGSSLARRSAPRCYDDGVLVVAVENSSVQKDMNFKKNAIKNAILQKTSLTLKDIKTEIAPSSARRSSVRTILSRRRKRRTETIWGPELDDMKAEILEQNPGISEKIAEAIARCRVSLIAKRER
jgi:hypothetical protein